MRSLVAEWLIKKAYLIAPADSFLKNKVGNLLLGMLARRNRKVAA